MTPEEERLRKEALKELFTHEERKQIFREWLDDEKRKTYEKIGEWFVNAVVLAGIGAGMWLMLWFEKHKT